LTPFGVAVDSTGVVRTRGVVSTVSNLRGLVMQARLDEPTSIEGATAASSPNLANVKGVTT
jgi:hypothetical protein